MSAARYLWGYGSWSRRLTLDELAERRDVADLNPEFRRRLFAMMVAARTEGVELGIGGGARSSARQEATFRERYTPHLTPPGVYWSGRWWRRKPGVASAAPPGRSYHEDDIAGGALAADMIGDLSWMNANCHRWNLRHFANVNREPWHVQPGEVPTARRNYDPRTHMLIAPDTPVTYHYGAVELVDTRRLSGPVTPGQPLVLELPDADVVQLRVTAIGLDGRGHLRCAPVDVDIATVDAVANYDRHVIDSSMVDMSTMSRRMAVQTFGAPAHVKITVWAEAKANS